MTIQAFNQLSAEEKFNELIKCCGSTKWANELVKLAPFNSLESIIADSDFIWNRCVDADFREAFSHHPKIGDVKSLEKKFASTKQWAAGEQAAVSKASQEILEKLAQGNEAYEKKFGYIFIVCATGKTAEEMLDLLNQRLPNAATIELGIAAAEQNKITHIRIKKLLE